MVKAESRTWQLVKDEYIVCSPDPRGDCIVVKFLDAAASEIHDVTLQKATKAINGVLKQLRPPVKKSELALLRLPNGLFLVWCRHDKKVVAWRSSSAAIKKAFALRSTGPSSPPNTLGYCRPNTRSWIIIENGGRKCYCYLSPDDLQWTPKLLVASRLTPFHDEQLANATREINRILAGAEAAAKSADLKLAILRMPNGLLLGWTQYGMIGASDDERAISSALGAT